MARWFSLFIAPTLLLSLPELAVGQYKYSRWEGLFPPVVTVGLTQEARVTGKDLDEVFELWCADHRILATPKMLPANEFREFPEAEPGVFLLRAVAGTPPNSYELRCRGRYGLSGPRRLLVTTESVSVVSSPGTSRAQAVTLERNQYAVARAAANARHFYEVDVPAGTSWTIEVDCGSVDSRMRPKLVVVDGRTQKEVGTARGNRRQMACVEVHPDRDTRYRIAVSDQTFRGGAEYVYLVRVHDRPRVVAYQPVTVSPAGDDELRLFGYRLGKRFGPTVRRNGLESCSLKLNGPPRIAEFIPGSGSDEKPLWHSQARAELPACVQLAITDRPVVAEADPNDARQQSQKIPVPSEVSGSFSPTGDRDWFQFEARAGQDLELRVESVGTGAVADPVLVLYQGTPTKEGKLEWKRLKQVDDVETPSRAGWAFGRVHGSYSDPRYRLRVEKDGLYAVELFDAFRESRGTELLAYRFIVSAAEPAYAVSVLPPVAQKGNAVESTGYTLRRGGSLTVPIKVHRANGAASAVKVWATGLPPGMESNPIVVPASATDGTLVVAAQESMGPWCGTLRVWCAPMSDSPPTAESPSGLATSSGTSPQEAEYLALAWGATNMRVTAPIARHTRGLVVATVADDSPPVLVHTEDIASPIWRRDVKLELPVELERRRYDGAVEFTVVGLPGKSYRLAHHKIEGSKGIVQLEVADDKKPPAGWHTFYLQAKVKSSYSPNPQSVRRAEGALRFAEATIVNVAEAQKAATTEKSKAAEVLAATQKAADAAEAAVTSARAALTKRQEALEATYQAWRKGVEANAPSQELVTLADALQQGATEVQKLAKAHAQQQTDSESTSKKVSESRLAVEAAEAKLRLVTDRVHPGSTWRREALAPRQSGGAALCPRRPDRQPGHSGGAGGPQGHLLLGLAGRR